MSLQCSTKNSLIGDKRKGYDSHWITQVHITGFDLLSVFSFQYSNPNSSVYITGHYCEDHQFNISIFPDLIIIAIYYNK